MILSREKRRKDFLRKILRRRHFYGNNYYKGKKSERLKA
jgi:hypothetical protein